MTAGPLHIGLVACSRIKADRPFQPASCTSRRCSALPSATRSSHTEIGHWLILSAKYGLVDPDRVLAPYDLSLRS